MNGLIDYQCEVHESGYETILVEYLAPPEVDDNYVEYIKPIDPKSAKRIFNLIEHSGAYREFAWILTGSEELSDMYVHIINFTNKYGLLTNPSSSILGDKKTLLSHMAMMSVAVTSLQYIKEGAEEELNRLFIKEEDHFKLEVDDAFIFGDGHLFPIIGQTPPRNSSEAAYHYICKVVNKYLKDSLVTEIIANQTNTGTDMIVRPKDLLSALWLQLAHAVSRNLEFKQCSDCSTFFEVKSKKRRFEKIYCSDKCRKRVSARKRREKEKAS